MENLKELNLVELNAQEIETTEGGDGFDKWYDRGVRWYNRINAAYNYLSNMDYSGGNTPYTDGSYMFY